MERRMTKIAVLVGSLRADSFNLKLAKTLEHLAPEGVEFSYVDIQLPLFSQDTEVNFPAEVQAVKDQIVASDGVLFVTPEYNRSVPGVLKNAIDWASRPYGKSAFNGKPVGIVGASGGPVGTAIAQSDLRHIVAFLNMKLMGQPEIYVANAGQLPFSDEGVLTDEHWQQTLANYIQAFATWVEAEK